MSNIYYKDIIQIIEQYSNIKNIYNNYINSEKPIIYKCDYCNCFTHIINKKNKILYELESFNNNLLNFENKKFKCLNLEELFIINNINYYDINFKRVNLIFCNLCLYQINKKSYDFNIFNTSIFDYISNEFYKYIQMNNKYFIFDKLFNRKNITLKRIIFKEKNKDSISLKYININNYSIDFFNKLKEENYNILNNIIFNDFNFDLHYLNNYIKVKYE